MSHHDDAVHPASVIHLQQARQSGQVAKSQELSASLQLVFSIAACWFLFSMMGQRLQDFASETWSSQRLGSEYNSTVFNEDVRQGIIAAGSGILPLLGIIMVVGILSHYLQTGPVWVAKSAVPDPNRLSPKHWWKQLFSLGGVSRSVLGVPKLTVVFVTTSLILWYRCGELLESTMLSLSPMVDALSRFVFGSCLVVALVLLGMSLLDFVIEYFSFHQRLRMTDQQLRDEQRSQSGDPQIINKRRRLHRQLNGRNP